MAANNRSEMTLKDEEGPLLCSDNITDKVEEGQSKTENTGDTINLESSPFAQINLEDIINPKSNDQFMTLVESDLGIGLQQSQAKYMDSIRRATDSTLTLKTDDLASGELTLSDQTGKSDSSLNHKSTTSQAKSQASPARSSSETVEIEDINHELEDSVPTVLFTLDFAGLNNNNNDQEGEPKVVLTRDLLNKNEGKYPTHKLPRSFYNSTSLRGRLPLNLGHKFAMLEAEKINAQDKSPVPASSENMSGQVDHEIIESSLTSVEVGILHQDVDPMMEAVGGHHDLDILQELTRAANEAPTHQMPLFQSGLPEDAIFPDVSELPKSNLASGGPTVKTLNCPLCNHKYKHKGTLKKHLVAKHKYNAKKLQSLGIN